MKYIEILYTVYMYILYHENSKGVWLPRPLARSLLAKMRDLATGHPLPAVRMVNVARPGHNVCLIKESTHMEHHRIL